MNLIDLVYKNARMYPDDTAYVEIRPVAGTRKTMSWNEFDQMTEAVARNLHNRGIGNGDKALLLGRNSLDWLVAYFGIAKTGAWVVPLNFRFTGENIEYCAAWAEPKAFFFEEEYASSADVIRKRVESITTWISLGENNLPGCETLRSITSGKVSAMPPRSHEDEDELGLYFTSGTTGMPKPILLRHKNYFGTAINEVTGLGLTKEDTLLYLPPMYHVAMGHLLGNMLVAATTVMLIEQITPRSILDAISSEGVRNAFLLVPWVLDILEAFDKGELSEGQHDLSQWRLLQMGAQPIPTSLVKRWKAYFPTMQFHNTYGLSETAGPGTIHCSDETRMGAIGKPGLLWDARVVDPEGRDVGQGEVGEIIVKGMGVMKEYYKNPEMTAQALKNGWLYTGDMGRMDEEGFFYLVDRKKDLVISGGENIFPVEVEEVIQKHRKVRDVAVIGMPDERMGEIVTAVIDVVDGENLTEQEIKEFCDENLPRYKRPRNIIFDKVPRSPTGKIEKPKLRAKYIPR